MWYVEIVYLTKENKLTQASVSCIYHNKHNVSLQLRGGFHIIFFLFFQENMLWVLIRSVSVRGF